MLASSTQGRRAAGSKCGPGGGEQERAGPERPQGRSRRAWWAAASCLNKMQSGGFREKRACLSKATLAPRGSEPTMGGGRREGRAEATAMV